MRRRSFRKVEGMSRFEMKRVVLFVAVWYFFYAIIGCGSSHDATKHLDKYDDLTYSDKTTVNVSRDVVYKAAILSLQQRGYVVTMSDPQTGLINAEINSGSMLPEEQKAEEAAAAKGPSVGRVLLVILSIILVFGIVLLLVGSSDDKSKDERSRSSSSIRVNAGEPTNTSSYRYILTLTMTALADSATEFQISAVRMVLENGGVIESTKWENKYLNYSVFDALYDQLGIRKL
jgi:hypothetical protein